MRQMRDIRLGKIFGIEIDISYSWFFIFALVTVTLAFGLFPASFPRQSIAVNVGLGFFTSAIFFASLLFHELSHSLVANRNKIPIERITLFIFGGMSQMTKEPASPGAEFKMAIAGPASSFLLAVVFYGVFVGARAAQLPSPFWGPFIWLAEINFLLAVFNLAPGFPLDGGRVLRAVVWSATGNLERATRAAARVGEGVAFLLMAGGLVLFVYGGIGGIWLILIGWFLYQAAEGSYRQMVVQQSLADVAVKDIMTGPVQTVDPRIPLDELVNEYFLKFRYGRFPVAEDGTLLGVVTLHDVKEVPRERWRDVPVGRIVEPLGDEMLVHPGDEASEALAKMAQGDIGHLLVVDQEAHLVGIVTRTDLIRLIRMKSQFEVSE